MTCKFDAGAVSDAGTVKTVNQDSHTILRQSAGENHAMLLAVADGISGLEKGEMASFMAVCALQKCWAGINFTSSPSADELLQMLVNTANVANDEIFHLNLKQSIKSGTTLSVLILTNGEYRVFHVGDSRIYNMQAKMFAGVSQISCEHTKLMPKEINGTVVMKPFLTECLGFKPSFNYQQMGGKYLPGEIFLLCTDGIYKTIGDEKIAKIIRHKKSNLASACQKLVETAKKNGETDNLTAAIVKILV